MLYLAVFAVGIAAIRYDEFDTIHFEETVVLHFVHPALYCLMGFTSYYEISHISSDLLGVFD